MFKRKISLVIVLMMVLSLMIPNFAFGATNDYTNHWAKETIQKWFDNDQLKGYEDGSFKPDQTITRAEFMTMVNNAYEFTEKAEISFKDVKSSDWFYQEVQKAAAEAYIIGYEDNTARPGNKISRQEAALIISRIKELTESPESAKVFKDYRTIATWSIGGVGAVAKEKIMIGYEDNSFRPDRSISRAEALVTIDRALEVVPIVETPGTGGGGGGGGGGGTPSTTPTAITPTAITFNGTVLTFVDDTTTTASAITTTSAAITITTYVEGKTVSYVTSGTGITGTAITVTTSSSINSTYPVTVPLATTGDTTITITVGTEQFIIIVTKE